ncbi:DUF924 family protein [Amaricoccus sp.]|uniref:DUF924 family protein n=1 Tax=Amaricoccus sp. TaxID=1872485 RepID=UPI001B61FE0D|nr:DUF924 family protein [Amaricoccus sp.]MBP7240937.1 DUF924 family protein [Amaricoccus sp.]
MTIHSHPSATAAIEPPALDPEAAAIVAFWQEAGPQKWFAKDPAFDVAFRDRFAAAYSQAVQGALTHWIASPLGALALALLLDQYPRNAFRGTPWMYATDAMARLVAEQALALGYWDAAPADLRVFLLLPFGHSERLADQERSVGLAESLIPESAEHARHHRDVVRTFGRFPHRNAILGRSTTAEERDYLDGGGYAG